MSDSSRWNNAFVLVGPTASGKSAITHRLAQQHQLSILSTDSMSVYTGMDIGTAKPSITERQEVQYYGLDLTAPDKKYSVGDYYNYVNNTITDEHLIISGGTGLYVKCLLYGMDPVPPENPAIRKHGEQLFAEQGLNALQKYAQQTAPEAYAQVKDPQNARRIIRALERHAAGSNSLEQWKKEPAQTILGLAWPRERLLSRIESRVEQMFSGGLLDEARQLREQYDSLSSTALQAIGYREAFAVLDGEMTEKEAKEKTIIRTRQLAKRQMTWFRNQLNVQWIEMSEGVHEDEAAQQVWQTWQNEITQEDA